MQFGDPNDLRSVVEQMRLDSEPLSFNRARINALANGDPPFTVDEQTDNNISTNVNFLEVLKSLMDARKVWYGAMLKPGIFFKVTEIDFKNRRIGTWTNKITKKINKYLKNSLPFIEVEQATGAQVILHGVGPQAWEDGFAWRPEEIGIEDLLVPSGTLKNLRNLRYFAIFRKYTAGQLYEMTHKKNVDPGWKMEVVNNELEALSKQYYGSISDQEIRSPEKLNELFKTNSGFFWSSAVPTVNVWDCYWEGDKSDDKAWNRGIILDTPQGAASISEQFIFKSPKPIAKSRDRIININFGDGANKAPFLYHSIRGLGQLLYGPGHLQNRLRCRVNDAIMENSVMGFQISNAEDRSRINKIDLFRQGIMLIPEGLRIIPESERRSVNQELLFAGLAQNRQLMSEAASQYTHDTDTGTQKERTATEVMADVNAVDAMVSGMLLMAYEYRKPRDREICRRFCIKNSPDPDVKEFQQWARNEGIPEDVLDIERWSVEPEKVIGGGNTMMAIARADKLMAIRPQLDPDAQREVTHLYVEVNSDSADLADRIAPLAPPPLSNSRHDGQLAAGAIMQGLPVQPRPGTNHIDYCEALLTALASALKLVQSTGGMATQNQLLGYGALDQAIRAEISQIAQDPQEKQRAGDYEKALTQMESLIKSMAQQLQKTMQQSSQNGQNGETQGKVQSMLIGAATKAKVSEANAQQKQRHKEIAFTQDQRRRDIETALQARRDNALATTKAAAVDLTTAAKIRQNRFAAFTGNKKSSQSKD
jgi:hypothetical protein